MIALPKHHGAEVRMRTPARRNEREDMIAYIHGVDVEGEIAHILVHQRGSTIRFSGKLGDHRFTPSNAGDTSRWISEAETVWGLESAIAIPRGHINSPEVQEKIELLKVSAAKKKQELAAVG